MTNWLKCRQRVVVATGMALYLGALGIATTAQPAGTSANGGAANTYKLSGAVTGTLADGPNAGCPYGGINNGGFVGLNDLVGSVSGIKGVASWTLDVNVKKNGTYTFHFPSAGSPTAILSVNLKGKNLADSIVKKRARQLLCPRWHRDREGPGRFYQRIHEPDRRQNAQARGPLELRRSGGAGRCLWPWMEVGHTGGIQQGRLRSWHRDAHVELLKCVVPDVRVLRGGRRHGRRIHVEWEDVVPGNGH